MGAVLVIDDEPTIREMISMALDMEGVEVIEAEGGRAGIELARLNHPALIISDLRMGGVDGLEVFDTLQKDPSTSSIPFVFISGLNSQDEIKDCLGTRVADCLEKPFSLHAVLTLVKRHLNRPTK